MEIKRCECGCGEQVKRSFLPGHDAKLKSRLVAEAKAGKHSAVDTLIERGWGHFVPTQVVAAIPERGRFHGRFVSARHISVVGTWVEDSAGRAHAHCGCPAIEGTWEFGGSEPEGWTCGVCVFTHTRTDRIGRIRQTQLAVEANAS